MAKRRKNNNGDRNSDRKQRNGDDPLAPSSAGIGSDATGKAFGRDAARAVRRVARAAEHSGGTKRFRRVKLGFPGLIAIIVVLGSLLVWYAASNREASARPRQNVDHWHSAYAVWDCVTNDFEPAFQSSNDEEGIHSHQDGVIHIHPFFNRTSGRNATMDKFLNEMNAEITDETFTLDDGRVWEEGEECDPDGDGEFEPAILQIGRWHRSSQLDRDPVIYTEDLAKVRFMADQEAFVIARAPEGYDIPPPPDDRVQMARGLSPQSVIDENIEGTENYGTEDFDPEAIAPTDEGTEAETEETPNAEDEADVPTEEEADTTSDEEAPDADAEPATPETEPEADAPVPEEAEAPDTGVEGGAETEDAPEPEAPDEDITEDEVTEDEVSADEEAPEDTPSDTG